MLELLDPAVLDLALSVAFAGLFNRSRTTQTTENTYNIDNSNVGASGGGIAARNSIVQVIDPGAFKLGETALKESFGFTERTYGKTLQVVTDTIGKNAVVTTNALAHYQNQARDSLAQVVGVAAKANTDSVQQLTENVFKYGVLALVGVGGAAAAVTYFANR